MTQTFRFDPMLPEGEIATLRRALQSAGWRETLERDWDLYWDGSLPDAEFFASLQGDRWVNHFPGYGVFGDKGVLHDNLARRWAGGGRRFPRIHPRSFAMPDEYGRWRKTAASEPDQLWLVKPRRLSQGREIALVRDPEQVPRGPKWIVQEYIQRPHLLDGYKYVLRFYLLLTSLDPLICYLHDAGVCKRTSRPYTLDPDSLSDRFVHLTNPALQRRNEEAAWGAHNTDHETYRARLRREGVEDDRLFAHIRDVLIQTVVACREEALMRSRAVKRSLATCFELIGADLMIDEDLRPWVLELNPSPSLEVGPDYDADAARMFSAAKEAMLFNLVSLLPFSTPPLDPGVGDLDYWRRRAALELDRAGRFQRIWPAADSDRFVQYFPLLRPLDQALAADACERIKPTVPAIRPAQRIDAHPLADALVLYAADRQRFYALNAPGAATWLALSDGLTPSRAIEELAGASPDGDRRAVAEAVWDLLVAWAQSGLLAGFEQRETTAPEPQADAPWCVAGSMRGAVLVVPLANEAAGAERVELPAAGVRRLVLVESHPASGTKLAIGHPAAALDALVARPGVAGGLDPARAEALVAWLDGLEIFIVEVGAGAQSEAQRLTDLVCESPLIGSEASA